MNKFRFKDDVYFYALLLLALTVTYFATRKDECVYIKDATFKEMLVEDKRINKNGDSEIQLWEAANFTGALICTIPEIKNFVGLEAFTSLSQFSCENTSIRALDITKNVKLTFLNLDNVHIKNIDISQNKMLKIISCAGSSVETIDLSNCKDLEEFWSDYSQVRALNFTNNRELRTLSIAGSNIETLDIISNRKLRILHHEKCYGLLIVVKNDHNVKTIAVGSVPKSKY